MYVVLMFSYLRPTLRDNFLGSSIRMVSAKSGRLGKHQGNYFCLNNFKKKLGNLTKGK